MLSKSFAALAALSMAVSPAIAQTAAPSIDRSFAAQAESNELVGGAGMGGSGWLIGLGAVAAIIAVLALTDTWPFDDDDEAVSP